MSYEELESVKMLNGLPKDQTIFQQVIINQQDIKDITTNFPVLTALETSLVPSLNLTLNLGEESLRFLTGYIQTLVADTLVLDQGNILDLAIKFSNDENTGIFSPGIGLLDIVLNTYTLLEMSSSSLRINTSNNNQLFLFNTNDNSLFSIGVENDIFSICDKKINNYEICRFLQNEIVFNTDLKILESIAFSDYLLFENSNFLKIDYLTRTLLLINDSWCNLSINLVLEKETTPIIKTTFFKQENNLDTNVKEGDILCSLSFAGSTTSDRIIQESSRINVLAENNFSETSHSSSLNFEIKKENTTDFITPLILGQKEAPEVLIKSRLGFKRILLDTPGTYTEFDVSTKSMLKVDTSAGDIILETLGEGDDCQMLFIFKSEPTNNLTIKHNSTSNGQKIMTQNQADLTLGIGYGGCILYCDEGIWKEISIS